MMSSSRRIYTIEFKQEAVRMVAQQGLSPSEVASRLGIDVDRLRRWRKAFPNANATKVSPRQPTALEAEVQRLHEEVRRLTMEREILKKATAFFAKQSR